MKKLKKLDKYVILPNVGFYGGFVHEGQDVELCDDHDTDEGYDFHVKQRIEGDVLFTDIERSYTRKNGKQVAENSHMEVEIEKGQLRTLFQICGFRLAVEDALQCPVDLVTSESSDPAFLEMIKKDEVLLYGTAG